jgi:TPR repeat protein
MSLNLFANTNFSSLKVEPKEVNVEKKSYKELITYLKSHLNGENAYYLGMLYLNGSIDPDSYGESVNQNTELAEKYLMKASDLEFPFGSITLGSMYIYNQNFKNIKNKYDKAELYLKKAISEEIYEAYTILGDLYINYKNKPEDGIKVLFEGAKKGIASSQMALAMLYNDGYKDEENNFELNSNEEISSKYLTKACLNKNITPKIKEMCYNNENIEKIEVK